MTETETEFRAQELLDHAMDDVHMDGLRHPDPSGQHAALPAFVAKRMVTSGSPISPVGVTLAAKDACVRLDAAGGEPHENRSGYSGSRAAGAALG
jgi:hypothetical protein